MKNVRIKVMPGFTKMCQLRNNNAFFFLLFMHVRILIYIMYFCIMINENKQPVLLLVNPK